MPENSLHLIVQTPHNTALEIDIGSLRFPTQSGQVGLRPRSEAALFAVETGIVQIHRTRSDEASPVFLATAGGLLLNDGVRAMLLTPLAFTGSNESEIIQQLDDALRHPDSELGARVTLSKLEGRILTELRNQQLERQNVSV